MAFPANREVVRRPPAMGIPGQKSAPVAAPEPPDEPDTPDAPPDTDVVPPNPTAVGFRTEAETCGHCTYFAGGSCEHPLVAQAVSAGDSCAAFEANGNTEQMGAGDSVEGESAYA